MAGDFFSHSSFSMYQVISFNLAFKTWASFTIDFKSNYFSFFSSSFFYIIIFVLQFLFNYKSHKLPFSNTSIRSSRPLDVVFSDVWTAPSYSVDGFKYYIIFVDHFTRYIWLYPLKLKSQVIHLFPTFKALVEHQFSSKIKTLYSDNGGEYIGLRSFLADHGIQHLTSPPHTPEHNGIAER